MSELVAVLPQHRFDETALARHLERVVPMASGPLTVRQFQGGQSNPTFLLRWGEARVVLRKQPPGELLPRAHQIDREYRVMAALAGSGVPVPRMLHFCADACVIGTPFYVMEHVEGRVLPDPALPELSPEHRGRAWHALISVLAQLHRIDWRAAGLADFGRLDGYAARQVKRWSVQYEASRTDAIPAMEALARQLAGLIPKDDRTAIVHGDYRFGNAILAPDGCEIRAILDWELATIGHPIADLAYCCMPYHLPTGGLAGPGIAGLDHGLLGLPAESTVRRLYEDQAGIAVGRDWPFFVALALFRLAAIVQGVYARALKGNASSESGRAFGARVQPLAEAGLRVLEHG